MWLEIIGTTIGLIYLWLEYRASIYVWITGIIMPAIYTFIYYKAGLYADFGINIYYIIAAIYGYAVWRWGDREAKEPLPITHTPLSMLPSLIGGFAILFLGIAFILIRFTDSTVPCADSFTTSLSIVAMYMLARKHAEQWLAWIVVDVVCCVLYAYKELYFTSGLYAIYTIIAFFGYRKWLALMSKQEQQL